MTRCIFTCALIAVFLLPAACNKSSTEQDSIRATIDKHLATRTDLNMSAMDREIKQIVVNGDKATAQVEFKLKQGGGSMQVDYALAKQGGEWTVLVRQPSSNGEVAHPSMDQHPAVPGSSGELPSFDNLLRNRPPSAGASPPAEQPRTN